MTNILSTYGINIIEDIFNKAEGFGEEYPYGVSHESQAPDKELNIPPALQQVSVFYYDKYGKKFHVEVDMD